MPRVVSTLCSVAIATLTSACVPSATLEQRGEAAANRLEALSQPADDQVRVANNTYVVRVNGSRTSAVVTPLAGLQHNIERIEAAAAQRTGCSARATPEIYAMMRGRPTVQIPSVRLEQIGGQVPVDLSC